MPRLNHMTPGDGHCLACGASIRPGLLLCRPHWFKVSKRKRNAVWEALDRYEMGSGSLEELRTAQEEAKAEALLEPPTRPRWVT